MFPSQLEINTTVESFDLRMNADCTLFRWREEPDITGFFCPVWRGLYMSAVVSDWGSLLVPLDSERSWSSHPTLGMRISQTNLLKMRRKELKAQAAQKLNGDQRRTKLPLVFTWDALFLWELGFNAAFPRRHLCCRINVKSVRQQDVFNPKSSPNLTDFPQVCSAKSTPPDLAATGHLRYSSC